MVQTNESFVDECVSELSRVIKESIQNQALSEKLFELYGIDVTPMPLADLEDAYGLPSGSLVVMDTGRPDKGIYLARTGQDSYMSGGKDTAIVLSLLERGMVAVVGIKKVPSLYGVSAFYGVPVGRRSEIKGKYLNVI